MMYLASSLAQKKKFDEAIGYIKEVLRIEPELVDGLVDAGDTLSGEKGLQEFCRRF